MRPLPQANLALIALIALTACAGNPWRAVSPDRTVITVTGRLEALHLPEQGAVRLDITPRRGDEYALAPEQQWLGCIVNPRIREVMAPILRRLQIGQTIEVSGYWTARDEPAGLRHYINDTTSIDDLVRSQDR